MAAPPRIAYLIGGTTLLLVSMFSTCLLSFETAISNIARRVVDFGREVALYLGRIVDGWQKSVLPRIAVLDRGLARLLHSGRSLRRVFSPQMYPERLLVGT